jgi:two-component system, OmpR family, response regulator
VEAAQRILHVEDDPSIRMVTSLTLEKVGGFTVLSCESGETALKQAQDFNPQVLLLDVMMPGMDGPATLLALQQQLDLSDRLVLFMTAKAQQQELDHYQSLGAWAVISKPFDPMTLPEQINQHWRNFRTALKRATN